MALTPVATLEIRAAGTLSSSANSVSSASFTPTAGELLVVKVVSNSSSTCKIAGISGGGLTWTQQSAQSASGTCAGSIWTAAVLAGGVGAMTVTVSFTVSSGYSGYAEGAVERWPAGCSVGAVMAPVTKNTSCTGTITTTAAGSAVSWVDGDYNAITGARAYRGPAVEEFAYQSGGGILSGYCAYQAAATAGAQTIGMTAPTGQSANLLALEVKPYVAVSWKADLSQADTNAAGFNDTPWNRQTAAGNDTASGLAWPIGIVAAPTGRSGRAVPVTLPAGGKRYEIEPAHRSMIEGDWAYFGDAFYLAPGFPTGGGGFQVIEQQRQYSDAGSPPVAFEIRKGNLLLTGGYDGSLPNPSQYSYEQTLITGVATGRWYSLVYYVENFSATPGASKVTVWVDGAKLLDRFTIPPATINGGGTYRKQGLYHDDTLPAATIYHAGQATGGSYAAVDPMQGQPILIGSLVDRFDGTGPAGEWTDNGAGLSGGGAYVNCSQNAGAAVYSSRRSRGVYTWSGSAVTFGEVTVPGAAGDTANAQLWVQDSAPANQVDRLGFEYVAAANRLDLLGQTAGYAPIGTTVSLQPYDPVAHRWLRITHTGTAIVWSTSPDGLTWTDQRTLASPPAWTTKATIQVSLEAFRSTGTNDTLRVGSLNLAQTPLPTTAPTGVDDLQSRTLREVRAWEQWLTANSARGWVGEYGWVALYPDATGANQWSALGEAYSIELDVAGLSGTQWASGREWGNGYPLGVQVGTNVGDPLTINNTLAAQVVAGHPTRGSGAATRWRGVSLAGHERGMNIAGGGTVRTDAPWIHTAADFLYLAQQGVDLVRLPVAWERLQPTLGAALDTAALATLDGMLTAARQAGIRVVLDLHNYGRYTQSDGTVAVLGGGLSTAQLTDFWTRLSGWLLGNATRSGGVVALGLMNEPHDLPGGAATWTQASRSLVTAIRNAGDTRLLLVGGYQFSSLTSWSDNHPTGWISDPAGNFAYEAHHYWDTQSAQGSRSGTYQQAKAGGGVEIETYATELAAAGTKQVPASAALTGSATLGGAGTRTTAGAAALAASGTLTGAPSLTTAGAAGMTGSGALAGASIRSTSSDTALAGAGALRGDAVRSSPADAALAGTAALAATVLPPGLSSALAGTGVLAAAALLPPASAALAAAGSLTTAGTRSTAGTAALAGAGVLAVGAVRIAPDDAALSGAGALDVAAALTEAATAALSGAATLGGAVALTTTGQAALAGAGALSAPAWLTEAATVGMAAAGSLTTFVGLPGSSSFMAGSGGFAASALPTIKIGVAGLAGDGALGVDTILATAGGSLLEASGTLTVDAFAFTPVFIPPPGPQTPLTPIPVLRLLVADTVTGRVGYELAFTTLSWDAPLGGIGTGSATLPVEAVLDALHTQGAADPRLALREILTGPYRYSMLVCFGGQAIMGGPYLPSDDLAADSTIQVGWVGMERMLERRVLTDPDGTGSWADPSRDVVFDRTTTAGAVYRAVAAAIDTSGGRPQRALPIVCSDPPPLVGQETFSYPSYDLRTVWDAVDELTKRDDGPDIRLEPLLVDRDDGLYAQWDLQIGRPYLLGSGAIGPDGPLPWPFDDSTAQISRTTDPVGMGTVFWGAGSGQDRDKVIVRAATDRLTSLGFPELETVSGNSSSEVDEGKLTRQVTAAADAGSAPTDSWTLKAPADGAVPLGAVRRGDPITVEAARTLLIEPGVHTRRVTKLSGSADPWVELTCDHEDGLAAGDPVSFGWHPDTAVSFASSGSVLVPGSGGVSDTALRVVATTKAAKSDASTRLAVPSPATGPGQQLLLVGFTDTDGTTDEFTAPTGWTPLGASPDPHGGWGKAWTRVSTTADVGTTIVTGQASGRSCVLYCLAFSTSAAVADGPVFTGGGSNPATTLTASSLVAGAGSVEVAVWAGADETGSPTYRLPAGWTKPTGDLDSGYETGTLAVRTLSRGGQTDEPAVTKTGAAVKWSAMTLALGTAVPRPAGGVARKVTNLTGPGFSDQYGFAGTDLGAPARTPDGRLLLVFGDTFDGAGVGGPGWRTPVGLFADPATLDAGLRWTGPAPGSIDGSATRAGQLVPQPHNSSIRGYNISTQLPSDVLTIGNTMYLQVIACDGFPNAKFTEIYKSTDNGATWTSTGCWFDAAKDGGMFQLWTWERGTDGYVYVISTGFQRDKGLNLYRVPEGSLTTASAYQPWGYANGAWAWGNPPTPILGGKWGEMTLRRLDSGRWLFSGFDAGNYAVTARDLGTVGPTADFTKAPTVTLVKGCGWQEEDHAHGLAAQLYAGYLLPGSTLSDAHFVVSQWNTDTGWPYRSMQFRADLAAAFATPDPGPGGGTLPAGTTQGSVQWAADLSKTDVVAAGFSSTPWNTESGPAWPPPIVNGPGGYRAIQFALGSGGKRIEVEPNHRTFPAGDDAWFGFAFYLEGGFPLATDSWQVIWQLHGDDTTSPQQCLQAHKGGLTIADNYRIADLATGRWYRVVVHASMDSGGTMSVWLDDQLVCDSYRAGLNATPLYLKNGLYHDTAIPGGTMYQRGHALGTGYGAVRPS